LQSAPERLPSRDIVDFYFLSLSLSLSSSPRARHNTSSATQDEYELRVPITLLSALTAFLPFHFPFILHLCSRILALSNNAYRHLATTTRHPYVLSFTLPFIRLYTLFNPHHWYLRDRLYDTDLIGSAHVFKSALLPVEEGIDSN
jgi:hypothetical protein